MAIVGKELKEKEVCVSCDIFTDYLSKLWSDILASGQLLDLAETVDDILEAKDEIESAVVTCESISAHGKGYYSPKEQWDELRSDAMMRFSDLVKGEPRKVSPLTKEDQKRLLSNIERLRS